MHILVFIKALFKKWFTSAREQAIRERIRQMQMHLFSASTRKFIGNSESPKQSATYIVQSALDEFIPFRIPAGIQSVERLKSGLIVLTYTVGQYEFQVAYHPNPLRESISS